MNLKAQLSDWTDLDYAQHFLSQSLGLMGPEFRLTTDSKHIYWSANPVGEALYEILMKLVEIEVLEYRDEPDIQFRWNEKFTGTWERTKSGA